MAIGKYIYGIISSNPTRIGLPNPTGVDLPKPFKEGSNLLKEGLNTHDAVGSYGIPACKEVYFIPYQDIVAVVNDAEVVNYTHMFKEALARRLVEHQKVIERIMDIGYSIIPIRLGTFAMNEEEVKDILSKGYGLIKEIIPKISDKIEIDVVTTWSDLNATIKEVGKEKEIKEFKEELLSNPKGITVDDQLKVGSMLKQALGKLKELYASQIQLTLKTLSIDFRTHELMDDNMIMNCAFLIDKVKQNEFYSKIEDLNNGFAQELDFRCVGPLPAYSFYTLEIKKMQFNDVNWARKKLGILNDAVSKDEIKKVYQRQAFTFHPDKNPHSPGIEKEFDEIKKSYDLLLDYAQACAQAGEVSLVFNKDEFKKNAVLVKVKE